jgi:AhpD family alkylhydroperoxidase
MMQDWNGYREQLLSRVGDIAKHSPEVVRGFAALEEAPSKSARLDPKVHELIALAVAVTTRCDGCISVHTRKAIEHGATIDEITEALGVAIALNAGAAMTYSARVLDAHAQLTSA